MGMIQIKLKNDSHRQHLTTMTGYTINREYSIVDDNDREVQRYILNRDDVLIKELDKTIKSNSVPKQIETFKETNNDRKRKKNIVADV